MNFSWRPNTRKIGKLIDAGRLNEACHLLRSSDCRDTRTGRRLTHRLVGSLAKRANRHWISGDYETAWDDLFDAASVAEGALSDHIAHETSRLVELTIEQAAQLLEAGKPAHAEKMLFLLSSREILDRRADQMKRVCSMINTADQLAAQGRLRQAQDRLQEAQSLRPELSFLAAKMQSYHQQRSQLDTLTHRLRKAIVQSAWSGARQVSDEMLQIAPHHQLAIDAMQRCRFKENEMRDTQQTGDAITSCGSTKGLEVKSLSDSDRSSHCRVKLSDDASPEAEQDGFAADLSSFMLWIDGVGGFLVCRSPEVLIGQALPKSGVHIPVQADLRRRHLKIKRIEDAFVAEPMGDLEIGGQPIRKPVMLADKQVLNLGHGVNMEFRTPGPLGQTARIEFASRHRTEPWSDAVYLMGDALTMGPGPGHHIECPEWRQEIVIFQRDGELCLKGPESKEVDGKTQAQDVVLQPGTRVYGEDFSVTVESIR